jgi:hypothetical protein
VVPVEEQSVLSLHQMELRTTQRRPLREMLDGARKAVSVVCRVVGKLLRRTFVPQVVGIVAGFAVGLFGRQLVLPPETAPLGWLFIGVSKLGAAAVPINLILLGAALSRTPERGQLPPLTVAGITVGRMIFMPLCGLGVARLLSATHFAVIPYIGARTRARAGRHAGRAAAARAAPRGVAVRDRQCVAVCTADARSGRPFLARLPHPHGHADGQQHRGALRPRRREPPRYVGGHLLPVLLRAAAPARGPHPFHRLHLSQCAQRRRQPSPPAADGADGAMRPGGGGLPCSSG